MKFKKIMSLLLLTATMATAFGCQPKDNNKSNENPDTQLTSSSSIAPDTTSSSDVTVSPDSTVSIDEDLIKETDDEIYSNMLAYFYIYVTNSDAFDCDLSKDQLSKIVASDLENYLYSVYYAGSEDNDTYRYSETVPADDVRAHLHNFYGIDDCDFTMFESEACQNKGIIYNEADDTITAYQKEDVDRIPYKTIDLNIYDNGLYGYITDNLDEYDVYSIEYAQVSLEFAYTEDSDAVTIKKFSIAFLG